MVSIFWERNGGPKVLIRDETMSYFQLAAFNPSTRTWEPSVEPDVFVSYTLRDIRHMMELATSCVQVGLSVYADAMDPKVLGDGPMLGRYLKRQIRASRSLVVIWTDNTPKSNWVQWEVGVAYDEKPVWTYNPNNVTLPSYLESDSIGRDDCLAVIVNGLKRDLR